MIYQRETGSNSDIAARSMGDKGTSKTLLNKKNYELNGKISPEGKWLAYESNESRQFEIYVCSFPETENQRRKVSLNGGHSPLWSPDGRELYYRSGDAVMAVSIKAEASLNVEKPRELFKDRYALLGWDIDPDGKRFLMVKEYGYAAAEGKARQKINIVANWFEELKPTVPVN